MKNYVFYDMQKRKFIILKKIGEIKLNGITKNFGMVKAEDVVNWTFKYPESKKIVRKIL